MTMTMTKPVGVDTSGPTARREQLHGYPVHPAAGMFPLLGDTELDELAADIAANGLNEPIVLFDGAIVDGRNRLRACLKAKVTPTFRNLPAEQSPTVFAVSANVHRRHLTSSQRAAMAVELERMFAGEAAQRIIEGGRRGGLASGVKRRGETGPVFSNPDPVTATVPAAPRVTDPFSAPKETTTEPATPGQTGTVMERTETAGIPIMKAAGRARDLAARLVNASSGYTAQAKQLAEVAPDTFEQVRAGKITIPQASRMVFPDKYPTKPAEPAPKRVIRAPKQAGTVESSRVTLSVTVTFGSAQAAAKVLAGLDEDPRVLVMDHETVDEPPKHHQLTKTGKTRK